MFQVKEELHWSLATTHGNWLTADHRRKGGEALLTVQQQPRALVGVHFLGNSEFLHWHRLVGFPKEDCARRVTTIKRIEQVAHAGRPPDITALHFRQAQFPTLDHTDKFFYSCDR